MLSLFTSQNEGDADVIFRNLVKHKKLDGWKFLERKCFDKFKTAKLRLNWKSFKEVNQIFQLIFFFIYHFMMNGVNK